jgi:diguanylate cyclase (GGDEF)-like protein/PAS domain S-box-containing protein
LENSDEAFKQLFDKKQEFYSVEVRMKHKLGYWIWVLDSGQIVEWSDAGEPLVAIGTHIDISDSKNAQLELEKSERNLRQIVEHAFDIIYRIDMKGHLTYVSNAWSKRLGYARANSIGQPYKSFIHPDDVKRLNAFAESLRHSEESQTISGYRLKHANGSWRYYESNASVIIEDGQITGFGGIARDITLLIEKQREIEYLSYHDFLTGLYNRHYLDHIIEDIIRPERLPLCIISMDLNDLKHVNDTYGHHMGDYYIKQTATIIREFIPSPYQFRVGGDEFLIFVPNTDNVTALDIRATIYEQLKAVNIKAFQPSTAFGFVVKESIDEEIYEDIKKADEFMYLNKIKVKNGNY